ncbi:MAG: 2Fe-2S iron-sulfur cluster-binding protein, partial [Pseudomonadota bacterium]
MNLQSAPLELTVNGKRANIRSHPGKRLSEVLREELGLRGTKVGCDAGDCGACTVLVDGDPICACLTPVAQVAQCDVATVEGLSSDALDRLQQSFLRHGAAQCGICTPGMLMAATALLEDHPKPSPEQVEDALGGVLCRCTGYRKIIDAVCDVACVGETATPPAAGQAIGRRIERLDGEPKVAGTEIFGADYWPEGALSVRIIRSPHHNAVFRFGDLEAYVANTPGVDAVFTAADLPGKNCFGVIPPFADQPALAEGQARFLGEAVAVVAGDRDVLTSFDPSTFPVEWDELDAVLDALVAQENGTDAIHETREGNVLITGKVRTGNPEKALAD